MNQGAAIVNSISLDFKMIGMNKYFSSKNMDTRGLSAAFRQWKADSHCKYIHGYALEFEFEFGANELDKKIGLLILAD